MNRVKITVRIPLPHDVMLKHIAEVRGLTRYQALVRVIEIGLTSIMAPSAGSGGAVGNDDIAARLSVIEALVDRGLFTASASYVYARRAALRGEGDADKLDATLSDAVQSAYQRQRALASEIL
jgi:hypothetical protein